LVKAGKALSF